MYDSKPKGREGEPIESILPEAVSTTASTAASRARSTSAQEGPQTVARPAFLAACAVAGVEAIALVAVLAGAC